MPLQNRVDPFGRIVAVPQRGLFTGNRGVIHDPETRTLLKRRWAAKAWIVCECAFLGRRRAVMGRNGPNGVAGWTELFFLDEPTALAAGHRPCFFCRRDKAKEFSDCFGKAFGIARPKAREIDERLHRERLASGGLAPALEPEAPAALPDGAFIAAGEKPLAVRNGALLPWSFAGYGPPVAASALHPATPTQITPATTLAVLRNGYRPLWHPSSDDSR